MWVARARVCLQSVSVIILLLILMDPHNQRGLRLRIRIAKIITAHTLNTHSKSQGVYEEQRNYPILLFILTSIVKRWLRYCIDIHPVWPAKALPLHQKVAEKPFVR